MLSVFGMGQSTNSIAWKLAICAKFILVVQQRPIDTKPEWKLLKHLVNFLQYMFVACTQHWKFNILWDTKWIQYCCRNYNTFQNFMAFLVSWKFKAKQSKLRNGSKKMKWVLVLGGVTRGTNGKVYLIIAQKLSSSWISLYFQGWLNRTDIWKQQTLWVSLTGPKSVILNQMKIWITSIQTNILTVAANAFSVSLYNHLITFLFYLFILTSVHLFSYCSCAL